jgi:DNA-binding beta-propeller fold protein YncE
MPQVSLALATAAAAAAAGTTSALLNSNPNSNPNAWNLAYVEPDTSTNFGYDIGYISYSQFFSVSAQEANATGVFFKGDGTKMYVVGTSGNDVNEYSLSTAWDISTASYIRNFVVAAQDTTPDDLFFTDDGTKMYIIGSGNDRVYQYNLSTAWDISTASYLQFFSVSAQDTSPTGIFFKGTGTSMYILGDTGNDVNEYSLSTAWDISTASYIRNFSVSAQDTAPESISFSPDGKSMFVVGSTNDNLYQYSLSTAWDISTASYLQMLNIGVQDANPRGVFFKPDGTKMYMVGLSGDKVYEYDININVRVNISAQETAPEGIFFKPDGTKMYVMGSSGDDVNEYSLSTAWDIATADYVQSKSISAQESAPNAVFFKPDGTKMYVMGSSGDDVNEYSLSTAWDLSTVTYVQSQSVATQDIGPAGLFFKPDGTKMYMAGFNTDTVYQYTLSTPWDVSTTTFVQSFSVAAKGNTEAIFFKPEGDKMYIIESTNDSVHQYNLSSAWDISTASYIQSFSVSSEDTIPTGLFFKPDGTRMYVVGQSNDTVWQYNFVE